MNDRSRQNPAYRPTRYAPLALIGGGAPFYTVIEYKKTAYSLFYVYGRFDLASPPKSLTFRLFLGWRNLPFKTR